MARWQGHSTTPTWMSNSRASTPTGRVHSWVYNGRARAQSPALAPGAAYLLAPTADEDVTRTCPAPAAAVTPRVLVINYDPAVPERGGRPLHQALGWQDPVGLAEGYIADLATLSRGYVRYEIIDWQEVDQFPVKQDGFRYTAASYLRCWRNRSGWHEPDRVDYYAILTDFDIPWRVDSGEIDEVWLFGFPYAGFWESTMAGIGAYFCNSPPLRAPWTAPIFVTMGFNYERGIGEMLESFGHRVESVMRRVYGSWEHRETHAWNRFTLYDKVAPGRAACGNVHFAPNSVRDYDWGNPRLVWSTCDEWLEFPNLAGERRLVNREEWGGGNIRAHHRWWLRHLPHAEGRTDGILNNWWAYAVDFNRFGESR